MTPAQRARLEQLLGELDERNRDNISRTESYLELYGLSREANLEHPWLLIAHLVSRNAGGMMLSVAKRIAAPHRGFRIEALQQLFLLLERANFLIFYDAWWHVSLQLLGRAAELQSPRTPAFVQQLYARHTTAPDERALVLGLVENEQNLIERRVVHHPRYATALALIRFFAFAGAERSLRLGPDDSGIKVGDFGSLARRIDTGRRLYDEALVDPSRRAELYAWARRHPHRGAVTCRGDETPLREVWPVELVHALDPAIHTPPAPDPHWP